MHRQSITGCVCACVCVCVCVRMRVRVRVCAFFMIAFVISSMPPFSFINCPTKPYLISLALVQSMTLNVEQNFLKKPKGQVEFPTDGSSQKYL